MQPGTHIISELMQLQTNKKGIIILVAFIEKMHVPKFRIHQFSKMVCETILFTKLNLTQGHDFGAKQ